MKRGLWRGAHPRARTVVIVLVALGSGAAFLLFLLGAIGGTSDADVYGRVPLPGKRKLDLPAGDIALYYEERVTLDDDDSLSVPDGLVVVVGRELRRFRSEHSTPNAINLDGRSLREFGKLKLPEAGRYQVKTRAKQRGSSSPAVTLGKGQLENVKRAGIRAGIAEGAGLLAALTVLLLWRRPEEDTPVPPPPPSPGTGTSIRI